MPSHQDFGENALEVKKNPPATPPKLRREMGMCATTIYVQQQQQQYYTIRVLVVPTPVSSQDYLIARTCYKQSNAFLLRRRRRRSAVSPWNVGPLRSNTLRGIRSARSGLGQRSFRSSASALHRTSCHASISAMLEKRGGRCRTDRPIRVLSCQMRHTIAAIKAAWCSSLC